MDYKELQKEISIIILAAIILAISVSLFEFAIFTYAIISFLIIITANTLTKKIFGYYIETNVKTKFWSWYQYWFTKESHFINPIPMLWLPIIIAFITQGLFQWLGILEFEVEPRTERAVRRHGFYRFTQVTEWHIALIAISGIITNITLSILGYILGFETFAGLSLYYAIWSIIPIGSLDGAKILFGSKTLWTILAIILATMMIYSITII